MLTYETSISTSVHSRPTSPLTRRAARMAPVLARLTEKASKINGKSMIAFIPTCPVLDGRALRVIALRVLSQCFWLLLLEA